MTRHTGLLAAALCCTSVVALVVAQPTPATSPTTGPRDTPATSPADHPATVPTGGAATNPSTRPTSRIYTPAPIDPK
jgi:hypothetical protein